MEEVDGEERSRSERRSPRNDGDLRCHTEDRRRPFSTTRRRKRAGSCFGFRHSEKYFHVPSARAGSPYRSLFPTSFSAPFSLSFSFHLAPILFCSTQVRRAAFFGGGRDAPPSVGPRRDNQRYPMTKNPRRGRFDRMRNILFVLVPTTDYACF